MTQKAKFLKRQLQRLDQKLQKSKSIDKRFTVLRFSIFFLGVIFILSSALKSSTAPFFYGLCLFCFLCFCVLVFYHNRLRTKILCLNIWQKIKKENLARLCLNWDMIPKKDHTVSPKHPYALDLDIIGEHSLLRVLDNTISIKGRRNLMDWLLYPKMDQKSLETRQKLVEELKHRTLFRDKLILKALCISEEIIDGDKILACLKKFFPFWIMWLWKFELVIWIAIILSAVAWRLTFLPLLFLLIPYSVYSFIFFFSLPYLLPVFKRTISLQLELKKLQAIFHHLEKGVSDTTPELDRLCASFLNKKTKPSFYLKRISRICDALSIQGNAFIHMGINLLIPWDFFLHADGINFPDN